MRSRGHGCKLAPKCQAAVAALLTAPTLKQAAHTIGVNESTLRCWLKIPEFAALVREARQLTFQQALTRLQAETVQAVEVLVQAMTQRRTPDALKLKAAVALLNQGFKAAELHDLAERLAAVEAELAAARQVGPPTPNSIKGKARV